MEQPSLVPLHSRMVQQQVLVQLRNHMVLELVLRNHNQQPVQHNLLRFRVKKDVPSACPTDLVRRHKLELVLRSHMIQQLELRKQSVLQRSHNQEQEQHIRNRFPLMKGVPSVCPTIQDHRRTKDQHRKAKPQRLVLRIRMVPVQLHSRMVQQLAFRIRIQRPQEPVAP